MKRLQGFAGHNHHAKGTFRTEKSMTLFATTFGIIEG